MFLINRVALAAATMLSGVAVYDAIRAGLTGRPSGFSDEYGLTPMMIIGGLVHGLTYAALVAVLVVNRQRIDAGAAVRRWIRRLLVLDLGLMAVMFLVGTAFPSRHGARWLGRRHLGDRRHVVPADVRPAVASGAGLASGCRSSAPPRWC